MEFPARLLEQGNYEYVGSDTINAQQVKPPAVTEAEFRLADDMYDISNLVGGANGYKLSDQYREVLFSLVPTASATKSANDKAIKVDQEKIAAWLEEPVDNFDPPLSDTLDGLPKELKEKLKAKPPAKYTDKLPQSVQDLRDTAKSSTIPRVDLYQKLLDVYNSERYRWAKFKNDNRPNNFSNQDEVDAYDRLLSTYAPVVDAKLEALWTLLVVRGQYHRVRQYVGYIDIESASEVLLRAKENLRASVARSIDDTQDIYPVVMTPANWAKYLSTNFTPEDLLDEPSIVRQKLYDAEKNRAALINRRNAVAAGTQDISKLEEAERTAQREAMDAQTSMTTNYGDTTIRIVQLYFESATKGAINAATAVSSIASGKVVEVNKALADAMQAPLTEEQFKTLQSAQHSILEKQAAAQVASEILIQARLATETAKGKDPTNLLNQLSDQIASLSMDIEYYQKILKSADNPLPDKVTNGEKEVDPSKKKDTETKAQLPKPKDGASVWQEIVLTYTHNENAKSSMSSTSVSHSGWQTGLWFWSASGSSNSSSSSSAQQHTTKNTDVQIAFRAMKVAIQRPWMSAGLLAQTDSFYRTIPTPISKLNPADTKAKLDGLASAPSSGAEGSLLPSFPTSFIVAKDVHIVFSSTSTFDSAFVANASKSASSGGGFLCFSTGKSEASSDHREGAVVSSDGTHLSIKIAAPQILGWMSELVPKDNSVLSYTKLPDDEFENTKPASAAAADGGKLDGAKMAILTPPRSPGA